MFVSNLIKIAPDSYNCNKDCIFLKQYFSEKCMSTNFLISYGIVNYWLLKLDHLKMKTKNEKNEDYECYSSLRKTLIRGNRGLANHKIERSFLVKQMFNMSNL